MRSLTFSRLPVILAAAAVTFLLPWGGGGEDSANDEQGKPDIGLVFDVGGRGDKSFNDAAYEGLMRAEKVLGVKTKYIEPSETMDRETALRRMAQGGYKLVIGVGILFSEYIQKVARQFPDVKFACIDFDTERYPDLPGNLAALTFREEEGSFLVGALAALTSKTGKLGFIGGMEVPLIKRFEVGYTAGAKHVKPGTEVVVHYAGSTGDAFKNPGRGKELALTQYNGGADIIFHASGSTGLGVFQAAKEQDKLAIGVDSDQYNEAPGHILTSMLKAVDDKVFETIKAVELGTFQSGDREYGLKEKGVDYVYDNNNRDLIPEAVHEQVEALRQKIISGELKVPRE